MTEKTTLVTWLTLGIAVITMAAGVLVGIFDAGARLARLEEKVSSLERSMGRIEARMTALPLPGDTKVAALPK